MTICVSALAADGKAIVCVADKAISYGGYMQWDTDSTKIVPIGTSGVHALISGNETTVNRILSKLNLRPNIGQDVGHSKGYCESAYTESESEILEATFLRPFVTIADYNKAITGTQVNSVIEGITKKIDKAREEQSPVSCGLLLCGFDRDGVPFMLHLDAPGLATDMAHTGFHAVGSGYTYALSRLLWCDWARSHHIDRVLYECFDAKANAEMNPDVGYEWDAVILTHRKVENVPPNIKKIVERAWAKESRTPYEEYNPEEDLPLPPEDWQVQLQKYAETIMPSVAQKLADQP